MSKLYIESRYGQAPNELLNNKTISLKAKGLFTFMQSKNDGWDFSIYRIASQSKDGEDSVKSAIKELEVAGYLTKKPSKNKDGKWSGFDYFLHESPLGENPLAVKPLAEKPLAENTPSLSKKENSKKENSNKEERGETCVSTHTPKEIANNFFQIFKLEENDVLDEVKDIVFSLRREYGNEVDKEIKKFILYWTEPTPSGKKQLWETKTTFEVKRRLITWLGNCDKFKKSKQKKTRYLVDKP